METVLLVEDNADVREVLTEVLESAGYKVVALSDGREAVAYMRGLADARPSLMLLDLVMPGMNGTEVLRAVRAIPGPQVRTVVMTGLEDHGLGEKLGVQVVFKPAMDRILQVVDEACAPRRKRSRKSARPAARPSRARGAL